MKDFISKDLALVLVLTFVLSVKDCISKDLALVLVLTFVLSVKDYISKDLALALCRASSDLCPLSEGLH